jgi:hypothetical protein
MNREVHGRLCVQEGLVVRLHWATRPHLPDFLLKCLILLHDYIDSAQVGLAWRSARGVSGSGASACGSPSVGD